MATTTVLLTALLVPLVVRLGRNQRLTPRAGTAVELRYPSFVRAVGAGGLLLFAWLFLSGLLRLNPTSALRYGSLAARRGGGLLASASLPFAFLELSLLVESFTVFSVDDGGVTRRRLFGPEARVGWSEVRFVALNGLSGSVHLHAAGRTLSINGWMTGRDALATRLLESVPPRKFGRRQDGALAELRELAHERELRESRRA